MNNVKLPTAPRRLPTRRELRAEQRRALVKWADHLMARDGFHDASMDQIAEGAGVTRGAIYSMFGGKVQLLVAVLEARIDAADLGQVDGLAPRESTVVDVLRRLGAAWAEEVTGPEAQETVRLELDLMALATTDEQALPELVRLRRLMPERLARMLTGRRGPEGRPLDAEGAARVANAAVAALRGLAITHVLDPDAAPPAAFVAMAAACVSLADEAGAA